MNEERESFGEEGEIIMKNTSTIFWRENKVELPSSLEQNQLDRRAAARLNLVSLPFPELLRKSSGN